jgi:eukaryotic-like serine/threonine-protein kinase
VSPDVTTGADTEPRYRLDGRIATGGMGEVWRATDTVLGREVAVKVLKPEYADDPGFRSRFQAEARHAASLHHPGVAAIFDAGELPDDGSGAPRPYLVMELVPGQPLSALLRDGTPMPTATATDLVGQAAAALAAAHAGGVIHRDIKPGNLLVTPDGRVKVTDFGIARAVDAAVVTQTGQVLGTPSYLAPEQAEGRPATAASDVYSLGVVLYECLAGARPFVRDTPVATALAHLRDQPPPLPDSVPEHLRQTVTAALAKDPADRFSSMTAFADALHGGPVPVGDQSGATRVLEAASLAGPPTATATAGAGRVGTGGFRRPRRPAWLPWAAAAAITLVVVLGVSLLGGRGQDPVPAADRAGPSEEPISVPEDAPDGPEEGIEVAAEDYRGLTKDEAKARLAALGLRVKEQQLDNDGSVEEGTVLDVAPTGTLHERDEVTLLVAGPAPADHDDRDDGDDDEGDEPPGKSEGKGPKKDKE